ncbi:MAG: hypothetical protein ACI93S_001455 [Ancylomarina sp.]|jgi:hypothetical protein
MELARIEGLLEAYFEGNTSLTEERLLREYFTSDTVATQFQKYQPLFESFKIAQQEVSQRELIIPESKSKVLNPKVWWYGIAASAVAAIMIANFMFSGPSFSNEEKEALVAFNESKKAMLLLSKNFNNGAGQLAVLNQFTESKNRILK